MKKNEPDDGSGYEDILIQNQRIQTKEILNFKEGCIFAGITESYMYKMTSQRKIPHYKPLGKLIYFKRSELESFLTRNRLKTDEEIDNDSTNYLMKNRYGKPIR